MKKSEVVSGKERERKEKKKNNFYLSLSEVKNKFLNDKPLLVMINKDVYLKMLLLYRTFSTLLRALLSGNLKILEKLFANFKKCDKLVFLEFFVIVFDPRDCIWLHLRNERFPE